ncbi:SLBB domain-containing protein [Parapedobacter indicus]|uniref:Protein involved in polysaccharide export, contains SLBB domain of the beta-grasp fold n=1 Tax=Parapedobacter indicus TaxID=1477437 RepID=A0A1I3MZY0_9SPHI|nr:SLBB domain-containing protein [Parapedobacter indicus]PPL00832.1 protein involved in polysaccharide export with SLBB domain [Parapedobacter indicus]SFJ02527.1 protein involved in polysaccharide export, contains SLBB domain of the beta-grasp fold [Parapedobacter indicus]
MKLRRYHHLGSILLLFFSVICNSYQVLGQTIGADNLSQVRVDDLSDEQILAYLRQAESMGLSEEELTQAALQRGMPASEIEKLRTRISTLKASSNTRPQIVSPVQNRPERQMIDTVIAEPAAPDTSVGDTLPIFGASLFHGAPQLFEPNLRLATPIDYVLGPGDQVLIDIYGKSEENHSLNITPEGTINIPYVGVVPVAGMTIEQATARITSEMTTIYSAIRTGGTKVTIALGNIRSIKVILTGEIIKPGTYTLPSVATVFNALYYSGGPSENGSFRNVRLIRGGKEIAKLDIYDFLISGDFSENVRLEDQDVLMIPPYERKVEIRGEVKRPAIFELRQGETFQDLLAYAGGFTENAYTARIKVTKRTATEQRIEDLLGSQYAHYLPQAGDAYEVDRILSRFENRVRITGAVFRPGDYELSAGLTVSMLIKKAEGLKEDAFLNRGNILRLKEDSQHEQLSFNVAGIIAGTEPDIELKREDVVTISSIFDLREAYTVNIDGEVRSPGRFPYAEGITLQDLIMQAGGFRESASGSRIEISRRVTNADILSQSAHIAEVFQVNADKGLSKKDQDFVLMPFDQVVVRTSTGYETQKTVRIVGEVLYPGLYTINRKDERISDLINRAGGLTPFAYVDGASLKRGGLTGKGAAVDETGTEAAERERKKQAEYSRLLALQQLQSDASVFNELDIDKNIDNDLVGINLEYILKKPGYRGDLILEDGDVIHVPKELQTVKVSGEVLAPSTAVYSPSKGFRQYISQAGGFSSRALRESVYVLYANGSVKSTNRFLFFNNYPPIKPGAEIFVPQKEVKPSIGVQQWLGFGTGIASLAAIIVTIFR